MADPNSRYYFIETVETVLADGSGHLRPVRYLRRRFLPPVDSHVTMVEHRVVAGDRLDNLAARYLGDPLAYWHIADANLALQPEGLTRSVGRPIRIAVPRI